MLLLSFYELHVDRPLLLFNALSRCSVLVLDFHNSRAEHWEEEVRMFSSLGDSRVPAHNGAKQSRCQAKATGRCNGNRESTASVAPKPVKTSLLISESLSCPSVILPPDGEEISTNEPLSLESEISSESTSLTSQDNSNKEEGHRERHQIVNLSGNRVRSHSLSSLASDHHMKFRKPATARRLQKSISSRTHGELELEEVKGFMDLDFIFKKENVSASMMNVVPGLQRLGMHHNNDDKELMDAPKAVEDGSVEKEGAERSITRPYLSEAWLIKRPDSQLLNLKIPRLCSTEDMKKCLRFWAKTVAFEITKNESFYSI